jgi:hypothetical protein
MTRVLLEVSATLPRVAPYVALSLAGGCRITEFSPEKISLHYSAKPQLDLLEVV